MNFQSKEQSIHNYLEKIYDRLLKDCSNLTDWDTIQSICELEAERLSKYAYVIKEDIVDEIRNLSEFKMTDEIRKQEILSVIESIYQKLSIPNFTLEQSESMVNLYEERQEYGISSPSVQLSSDPIVNIGTPIGAILGIGIAVVITKHIPIIVLSTVCGAVVGTLVGKSIRGKSETQTKNSARETVDLATVSERERPKQRISHSKLGDVIQRRKTEISDLFSNYLQQVENAYNTIL